MGVKYFPLVKMSPGEGFSTTLLNLSNFLLGGGVFNNNNKPGSGGTGGSGKSKSSKDGRALRDGSLGDPQQVC